MASYRLSERADEDFESIYYRLDDGQVFIIRILRNQNLGVLF